MSITDFLYRLLPKGKRGRMGLLLCVDLLIAALSGYLALLCRFDFKDPYIPDYYVSGYVRLLPVILTATVLSYFFGRMYAIMWSKASIREAFNIAVLDLLVMLFTVSAATFLGINMPRSFYFLLLAFQTTMEFAVRFSYRASRATDSVLGLKKKNPDAFRVLIFGAGEAGSQLGREIRTADSDELELVCYLDDDPMKQKKYLNSVPVLGTREDVAKVCEDQNIDRIFIAIPNATPQQVADVVEKCRETGKTVKVLPGMSQLIRGEVSVSRLRDVEIEDLLGRDPIKVDMKEIFAYITGKTILVTGGGGSIGSELCRQIAAHDPKRLIIFDIYENSTYDIEQELRKNYPELDLVTQIGSVRDSKRVWELFAAYKPDIVYHAAAHKHVPLMEGSACEAIKNNAIGTYKTAYAAMMHGVQRFVLISTDKAVNPTNIMGASKRLCEMIIQSFDHMIKEHRERELPTLHIHSGDELGSMSEEYYIPGQDGLGHRHARTEFVAVRFGNVLGSNGSVIPLFKKQIAAGGPVTVTHPDIIRYFMTIPEAVSLVLQAGTYAKGGEIFVLDMGVPVKIDTLARNLIRLSGYTPDEDIKIVYTGLRPGEKLYEEKLMAEEGLTKTKNDLIHIGRPIPFNTDIFLQQLRSLMWMAYDNREDIRNYVAEMVSTYHPAGEHGSEKKGEAYREQAEEMKRQAQAAV